MRFSLRNLSISTRLALWYGLSLLLLLTVFVVFLYTSFHLGLHHDFNHQLQLDEDRLQALVGAGAGRPILNTHDALEHGSYAVDGSGGAFVRLLSADGVVLHWSANFPSSEFFAPRIPDDVASSVTHTWRESPARSLYSPVTSSTGEQVGWIEITRLESAVHRQLHRLGWLLAAGVLLGTVLAMAAGHRLARRALRPVTEMTDAATRIQAEDLERRLPADFGVQDELAELAQTLNGLLDRLDASFYRERRFRADAAHEMFTPLSAIQNEIDVALRRERDHTEYRTALETVRRHAERLSRIVEGLLELSRAESLQAGTHQAADVTDIASRLVDEFTGRARDQGVELQTHVDGRVHVRIDPADLETVLSNLIDNAIKYTLEGGRVIVSVSRDGLLRVADTGAGFSEDERPHLFDRFYRVDGTSTRGSGLGLSIAQAIVLAYGGTIEAESAGPGNGSTFTVGLPGLETV